MSGVRLLITGGAGFIGSAIVEAALAGGYEVRVLDSLRADVHGPAAESTTGPGPGPESGPMIEHGPRFRARARSEERGGAGYSARETATISSRSTTLMRMRPAASPSASSCWSRLCQPSSPV